MRRSETNTLLFESENGDTCPFAWIEREVVFLVHPCIRLRYALSSPECFFPKLLLLSWAINFLHCIFMGSQRHGLGGLSGGHLVQPLCQCLGLLPTLVEVNSDFFSSALENSHVTPQPLWADDISIALQVIFLFFLSRSLCPFFTILLTFALSAHLQFALLPRVLRKILSSLCPDTDPCDIHLLFFVKWMLSTW